MLIVDLLNKSSPDSLLIVSLSYVYRQVIHTSSQYFWHSQYLFTPALMGNFLQIKLKYPLPEATRNRKF